MERWQMKIRLCRAHKIWKGLPSDRRERNLKAYVLAHDLELVRALVVDPLVFGELSPALLADWMRRGNRDAIGQATLEACMPKMVQRWLEARHSQSALTFEGFTNDLLERYPTRLALLKFLGLTS